MDILKFEYINALILNILIKRHGLKQATYEPLKLFKPKELAILEMGELKIISLEEYANDKGKTFDDLPSIRDLDNIGQLFYVGEDVDLRVPPFMVTHYDYGIANRYSLRGIFKETCSVAEVKERVAKLKGTMMPLIELVHSYGGTFTEPTYYDSSVENRNLAVSGLICDLDTLSFEKEDSEMPPIAKMWLDYIPQFVPQLFGLFEDMHRQRRHKIENQKRQHERGQLRCLQSFDRDRAILTTKKLDGVYGI